MRLIMTHEQADLDALASLLGAHILAPDAYALLPRQINRNGQAFLRKHGHKLGFSRINDLPRANIEKIILVDTQSMVTLKGITRETIVSVIDHHPRKDQERAIGVTKFMTRVLVQLFWLKKSLKLIYRLVQKRQRFCCLAFTRTPVL